ncbi:MAG: hypothetical protein RLZ33_1917 [Bacteroidota bacterium]|jgi:DNA-binding LytR/AlgR family response regulator
MKVLICEDELIVAEYIKETCIEQNLEVVGIAKNEEEAKVLIASAHPDCVLLDVNLNERMSGIRIAEQLTKNKSVIHHIFITAFSDVETLQQAISTKPQGYLVKPVDKPTLIANLLLVKFKKESIQKQRIESVFLETESGTKNYDVSKLVFVESSGNYCDFILENQSKQLERVKLSVVEHTFQDTIIRIHKSYCVNPDFVVRFSSQKLWLSTGFALPIGRKYKENITQFLKGL